MKRIIITLLFGLVLGACSKSPVSTGTAQTTSTVAGATTSTVAGSPTTKATSTTTPKPTGVYPVGTKVSVAESVSEIVSVQIGAYYPGVTDTSSSANTPSAGHIWDAVDATECAGSKGSSIGANESDFSLLLSNGSSASVSAGATGSTLSGPLGQLSEIGTNLSSLSAGQCDRGWIVFSVPSGATPTFIQYSGTTASLSSPNVVVKWAVPAA